MFSETLRRPEAQLFLFFVAAGAVLAPTLGFDVDSFDLPANDNNGDIANDNDAVEKWTRECDLLFDEMLAIELALEEIEDSLHEMDMLDPERFQLWGEKMRLEKELSKLEDDYEKLCERGLDD